ncbi:MAG: hypothetical protein ACREP7_05740 [Lysobacter sp.]
MRARPRPLSCLSALAVLLCSLAAQAHSDRWITLQPDGRLAGIPEQFGRATADIRWPDDGPMQLKLTVGAHAYTVPACVTRLIRTHRQSDVAISASWYPQDERSNYYISMVFYDPGAKHDQIEGEYVRLTFDLFTARLRDVWVYRAWFLDLARRRAERDALHDYCSEEELTGAMQAR